MFGIVELRKTVGQTGKNWCAMKSPDWKSIADILATVAIVGSLVFVGLEIKQSRDIAIADVYQQQAALLATIQINYESSEEFYEARREFSSGEE